MFTHSELERDYVETICGGITSELEVTKTMNDMCS